MAPAEEEIVRGQIVALLPRLRRFALVLTRSRADADDLVQAACERAIGRLDLWTRGTTFDRWLLKIAHNLHRNQRRDQANRLRLVQQHGETQEWASDGAAQAESWTALQEVRRKVLQLPDEQRTALTLVAIEGLSYQEAAELLEVPVGTVTSRLARAREALRAALEPPLPAAAGARERA